MPTETTLALDARRRISVGALFDQDITQLIARRFDDGLVVLEPAVLVSQLEQRFHEDAGAVRAARNAAGSRSATRVGIADRRAARDDLA
jgi:hypothetical protein